LGEGRFRIVCTRGGTYVTIVFTAARGTSALEGEIDGKRFRIGSETDAGGMMFTDAQRTLLQPWNQMGEAFVAMGEAITLESASDTTAFEFPTLGCIAAGLGTGVAAAACLDGALPACAAGLYGLSYLSDHCI
jgi:hypothetical protein